MKEEQNKKIRIGAFWVYGLSLATFVGMFGTQINLIVGVLSFLILAALTTLFSTMFNNY